MLAPALPHASPRPSGRAFTTPSRDSGGWQPCTARVGLLIIGRAVTGIACGGATVVVPIYLGEISPAHLRGTLGTLMQLTCVIGMLVAQVEPPAACRSANHGAASSPACETWPHRTTWPLQLQLLPSARCVRCPSRGTRAATHPKQLGAERGP